MRNLADTFFKFKRVKHHLIDRYVLLQESIRQSNEIDLSSEEDYPVDHVEKGKESMTVTERSRQSTSKSETER